MKKNYFKVVSLCLIMNLQAKITVPENAKHTIIYTKGIRATAESLEGYGRIVPLDSYKNEHIKIATWPQQGWRPIQKGTGNEGGTVDGYFKMFWKGNRLYAQNNAVGRKYLTGWSTYPTMASSLEAVSEEERDYLVTFEANYHPDGEQMFIPQQQKPFVALLALPGDDVTPDDFVAFYCDGSFGIVINVGVWHQPLFCIKDSMDFYDKQGKVHACVAINFQEEWDAYIGVPLFEPKL